MIEASEPDRGRERLQQLTDQCLFLLDELAAARQALSQQQVLQQHAQRLADQVTILRRHMRATRVLVSQPAGSATTVNAEVFLWLPTEVNAAELKSWLGEIARSSLVRKNAIDRITLLADERRLPKKPGEDAGLPKAVGCMQVDVQSPAALWNLALAAARAPYVLLLAHGAMPRGALEIKHLALAADEYVAVLAPSIAASGLDSTGLVDLGDFELERGAVVTQDGLEVELASPEAFLVRRDAWTEIGPFDEDQIGYGALLEWTLRARVRGYRSLGLRSLVFESRGVDSVPQPSARDRLLLLAQHQANRLGGALARSDLLWQLSEPELTAFLQALWIRSPQMSQTEQRDLLTQVMVGVSKSTAPRAQLRAAADSFAAAKAEIERLRQQVAAIPSLQQDLTEQRQIAADRVRALGESQLALATRNARLVELDAQIEHSQRVAAAAQNERDQMFLAHQKLEAHGFAVEAKQRQELGLIAQALGLAVDTPAVAMALKMEQMRAVLAEREDWIATLLSEIGRTRLRVRPRKLLPHEQAFLAGRPPRS